VSSTAPRTIAVAAIQRSFTGRSGAFVCIGPQGVPIREPPPVDGNWLEGVEFDVGQSLEAHGTHERVVCQTT
jgi:hypothetical protein